VLTDKKFLKEYRSVSFLLATVIDGGKYVFFLSCLRVWQPYGFGRTHGQAHLFDWKDNQHMPFGIYSGKEKRNVINCLRNSGGPEPISETTSRRSGSQAGKGK
jgi:hypothetical protein